MENFTVVKLSPNNLDRYFIRKAIYDGISGALVHFRGELLDAGCGKMPYREFILQNSEVEKYVGLDIDSALNYDEKVKPDYTWDGISMPFEDNSFDTVMATEVLEHCPDPMMFLGEVRRVLRPGGILFFTVPFIWNLHEVPYDEYRYTPFALSRMFKTSGFSNIQINASGGWHAAMAQMLGLWVIRSDMNINLRRFLKVLLFPVYKLLLRFDKIPTQFKETTMVPSWNGVIR